MFILFPGCREPECTNDSIKHCNNIYFECLSEKLDSGTFSDNCIYEFCDCLERYNCEKTCEYESSCVEEEKPDT